MVKLSIIIPTRNEHITTEAEDVFDDSNNIEFEIIKEVDDGRGASVTRNRAISRANSNKLIFLDDDSLPHDGYLEAANNALNNHKLVAGRIIQSGPDIFDNIPDNYDQGKEPGEVEFAVGCNMGIRREVLEEIGKFDPELPYGHEETDLLLRAHRAGYSVWYEPDMLVEHPYSDSILDFWRKWWSWGKQDVKLKRKHGMPIFNSLLNFLPVAPGSSLTEIFVRSVGKCLRRIHQILILIKQDWVNGLVDNSS